MHRDGRVAQRLRIGRLDRLRAVEALDPAVRVVERHHRTGIGDQGPDLGEVELVRLGLDHLDAADRRGGLELQPGRAQDHLELALVQRPRLALRRHMLRGVGQGHLRVPLRHRDLEDGVLVRASGVRVDPVGDRIEAVRGRRRQDLVEPPGGPGRRIHLDRTVDRDRPVDPDRVPQVGGVLLERARGLQQPIASPGAELRVDMTPVALLAGERAGDDGVHELEHVRIGPNGAQVGARDLLG